MDLDETKRIIAAATEGPWEVVGNGYTDTVSGDGEDWSEVRAPSSLVTTCVFTGHDETDEQIEADHAFISHARTALPELVAEVERLRQALEDVPCEHQREGYLKAMRRAEAAEATVERVRKEHCRPTCSLGFQQDYCGGCDMPWPCPTIAALEPR